MIDREVLDGAIDRAASTLVTPPPDPELAQRILDALPSRRPVGVAWRVLWPATLGTAVVLAGVATALRPSVGADRLPATPLIVLAEAASGSAWAPATEADGVSSGHDAASIRGARHSAARGAGSTMVTTLAARDRLPSDRASEPAFAHVAPIDLAALPEVRTVQPAPIGLSDTIVDQLQIPPLAIDPLTFPEKE